MKSAEENDKQLLIKAQPHEGAYSLNHANGIALGHAHGAFRPLTSQISVRHFVDLMNEENSLSSVVVQKP